ncbi:MAG: YegP family protein [Flavobacteriales bacterium]|nr:YegP family protein [Flavobacteriales bacterium]
MATGRFEVFVDRAGEFRFNLLASNGQVILSSEGYTRKASCLNGIESVRRHSAEDRFFDRIISRDGQYRFVLKAANGEIIGTSERYTTAEGLENGIASVRMHAPGSVVMER